MGDFGGCAIFVQFWLAVGKQVVIIAPRNPPPSHFVSPGRHCPCLWHEWVPAQEMLAFASQVERTCRLECSCPRPRDLLRPGATRKKNLARATPKQNGPNQDAGLAVVLAGTQYGKDQLKIQNPWNRTVSAEASKEQMRKQSEKGTRVVSGASVTVICPSGGFDRAS